MFTIELRDSDEARGVLLQSLLWQCVLPVSPHRFPIVLGWALDLASHGDPLPPLGVLADIAHLALGTENDSSEQSSQLRAGLPGTAVRQYEDYVLGRLYADSSFERGSTAICRYKTERDQSRGLAFLINQLLRRADAGGFELSPAILKTMSRQPPEQLLEDAITHLQEEGCSPHLLSVTEHLTEAIRNTGDMLGTEDVFELEHGTALAEFGQRLALRQVLQFANDLRSAVPRQPVSSLPSRHHVTTNISDEDIYPVGGFTSISNRGSIESLLHSQLAFIEKDERPDLFDLKFLRDELLYYSRDDNQFLRQRRSFVVLLSPDLINARVKDAGNRFQRLIQLLSVLYVGVQTLVEWLDFDAIRFDFRVLFDPNENARSRTSSSLTTEADLLRMLFREEIAHEIVSVSASDLDTCETLIDDHSRNSLCQVLWCGMQDRQITQENIWLSRLVLNSAHPEVAVDEEEIAPVLEDDGHLWSQTLLWLLRSWMAGVKR